MGWSLDDKLKGGDAGEVDLYMVIDTIGGCIWRIRHEIGRGNIEQTPKIDKELAEMHETCIQMIEQLTRFGLKPLDENNRPTEDYWKWFRNWDQWKKGLSDEEWRAFDCAYTRGLTEEEKQQYQPVGRWQDHDGKYH